MTQSARSFCWLLLFCLGAAVPARAQYYETTYRPPGASYVVRASEHFEIIYQEGLEAEAAEAAAVLEHSLPMARDLVGLRRAIRLPVVLNGFNDRSNGYVTPLPFHQEVEAPRLRGAALSPRAPSWLVAVLPHELTHAAHAQAGHGLGAGWVVRPFAPDLARAINFAAPAGFAEGAAVYLESALQPGWGRLNFSLFAMQFRAAMLSDHPWNLTQLLEAPSFTRPLDRHYQAGFFFAYMAERDSLGFFPRARNAFYRFPILGIGLPLRYGAGAFPRTLGREMQQHFRARFEAELAARGTLTEPRVVSSAPGLLHRRPRWLDGRTVVVYATGYDVRPGFYRVDAETGRRTPLGTHRITEDYHFTLDADRRTLYYARYVTDPFVPIQARAEVFAVDVATGAERRLTPRGRVLAPVPAPGGGLWAIRNDGQFNHWVAVDAGGAVRPLTAFDRSYFLAVAPAPGGDKAAVLLNAGGYQGVFRATGLDGGAPVLEPWIVFEDASVFDLTWSDDGRYLLLTADPGGVADIYAFDCTRGVLLRLTNVAYGALEPSLSPDGRTLAFVHYRHERYELARIAFEPEAAPVVPAADYAHGAAIPWREWLDEPRAVDPLPTGVALSEARPYRAGAHLAPRMIVPSVAYERPGAQPGLDHGLALGLTVHGVDPLETWSYTAAAIYQYDQLWSRVGVASAAYLLRPFAEVYRRPSRVLFRRTGLSPLERVGREERGAAFALSLPVTLSSDILRTTAAVGVQAEVRQDRLFDERNRTLRDFQTRFTLRPAATLLYRVQNNVRDLAPNTGAALSLRATVDVATDRMPERWFIPRLDVYLPLLTCVNGSVRVYGSVLAQNEGSLLDYSLYLPRGYEERYLGAGTFARYGVEHVQPLLFVDNGFLVVPAYFEALYAYSFAERLDPVRATEDVGSMTALGAGLGLRLRLFHVASFDLRIGASYRVEAGAWSLVFR